MASDPLPADYPLVLYRGDTRVWNVLIEDLDEEGAPTAKDLTGHTMDAEIRATRDTPEVMAEITVAAADPVTGLLTLTLTAEEAAKLITGRAVWDLEIVRTVDEFTRTYLGGTVTVKGDVSRDG